MRFSRFLLFLVSATAASGALAEVCDTLFFGPKEDQVVVGEIRWCNPLFGSCLWNSYNPQRYGVCYRSRPSGSHHWEGADRDWRAVVLWGCTGAGSDKVMEIRTGGGDDRLTAMLTRYEEIDYWGRVVPFECGTLGDRRVAIKEIVHWNAPRLRAYMGSGTDRFYGSDHDDEAYSNDSELVFDGWRFRLRAYADKGNDILCGLGGDDILVGDEDNSVYKETLIGGSGYDACFGDGMPLSGGLSGPAEALVDGRDFLDCEIQRNGRAGRQTQRGYLCGPAYASPYNWRRGQ